PQKAAWAPALFGPDGNIRTFIADAVDPTTGWQGDVVGHDTTSGSPIRLGLVAKLVTVTYTGPTMAPGRYGGQAAESITSKGRRGIGASMVRAPLQFKVRTVGESSTSQTASRTIYAGYKTATYRAKCGLYDNGTEKALATASGYVSVKGGYYTFTLPSCVWIASDTDAKKYFTRVTAEAIQTTAGTCTKSDIGGLTEYQISSSAETVAMSGPGRVSADGSESSVLSACSRESAETALKQKLASMQANTTTYNSVVTAEGVTTLSERVNELVQYTGTGTPVGGVAASYTGYDHTYGDEPWRNQRSHFTSPSHTDLTMGDRSTYPVIETIR
ncbi:TPA: hypothetical protein ACV40H_004707, partial [Salmonella enterica]|nr:hypothetical protein [Salmonella enterica subsp. salamae]